MATVLFVKANNRPAEQAVSVKLYEAFLANYKEANPNDTVVELDLYKEELPYVGVDMINGTFKVGKGFDLTEEEAKAKYDIKVGKFQFAANGRALASGESAGFVKVIVDKKYDEILGVHIVGPSAAEMINEASGLMAMEITVDEVIKTIYAHPTYSEALFEACADALDEAIHLPRKRK